MTQQEFDYILKKTERRYGKLDKGEEDRLTFLFFAIEHNALKIHRWYPECNSRRFKEALYLTLHHIDEEVTGNRKDLSRFENEENIRLKEATLRAFEVTEDRAIEKTDGSLLILPKKEFTAKEKEDYYRAPALCIKRLIESVDQWMERAGSDGYFDFLEGFIGDKVADDNELMLAISTDYSENIPEEGLRY